MNLVGTAALGAALAALCDARLGVEVDLPMRLAWIGIATPRSWTALPSFGSIRWPSPSWLVRCVDPYSVMIATLWHSVLLLDLPALLERSGAHSAPDRESGALRLRMER